LTGTNTCATTTGKSITVSAAAGNLATFLVCVYPDGNAGTSTITITSGTYTVTKTVTFFGAPTKAVATQVLYVAAAGATLGKPSASAKPVTTAYATTYAYTAAVTDANGNAANPAAVKAVSSNTTVIVSSSCQQLASTPGSYNCDVVAASGAASGASATVTFEAEDASGNYTVIANPLTFRIGGSTVAKEVLALDNTSYDPGATATLSVTATDASGNPVADGTDSPATWTSTKTVQGLPSAASYYVNGVKSYTVYAPVVSGDFSVGATGDDANTTALSVAATVTNATSDAASLATDAANAATDAANAAAASADNATQAASDALAAVQSLDAKVSSLFASLQKQIAALTKLLKK
jgi:trimeric autotransporter adhesin